MDQKCHLTWANASATVRNVSHQLTGVFVLMRPRSGPSAKGQEAVAQRNDHGHTGPKIYARRHHQGAIKLLYDQLYANTPTGCTGSATPQNRLIREAQNVPTCRPEIGESPPNVRRTAEVNPFAKRLRNLLLVSAIVTACTSAPSPPTSTVAQPSTSVPIAPTTGQTAAPSTTIEPSPCRDGGPQQVLQTIVMFYALCVDADLPPYPVYRPGGQRPTLEQSVSALVAGTTPAERALGLSTGFDSASEEPPIYTVASIDADGLAHLELRTVEGLWDPGPLTSAQLGSFMIPLKATVFSIPEVTALDMSTLCWEELDCSGVTLRSDWEGDLFEGFGVLSNKGCTLEFWWSGPECRLETAFQGDLGVGAVVNLEGDDTLKIRSGPGTEYSVIGELPKATFPTYTKEAEFAQDGGFWRLVVADGYGTGWVNQAFLAIPLNSEESIWHSVATFAREQDDRSFAGMHLADEVALGLADQILKTVDSVELRNPDVWRLELEYFRGYSGPFSALELLNELRVIEVSVGEHPHCASPPVPPPVGFESFKRVSAQPAFSYEHVSCIEWFTVDFFVDDLDVIHAITLDLWEP